MLHLADYVSAVLQELATSLASTAALQKATHAFSRAWVVHDTVTRSSVFFSIFLIIHAWALSTLKLHATARVYSKCSVTVMFLASYECAWWNKLRCSLLCVDVARNNTSLSTHLTKVGPPLCMCDLCRALLGSEGVSVAWVGFKSTTRTRTCHFFTQFGVL